MLQRDSVIPAPAQGITAAAARGAYTLVVTATFAAEPDPFALTAGDDPPPALQVRMGSQVLLSRTDDIQPGQPMRVPLTKGLIVGANEIFVKASPPVETNVQAQAVRIQLLRDGLTFVEQTYWAAPGENVSETFRFDIDDQQEDTAHDH
jgi:hypothetical protein